jgi:hypothetical protein
MVISLETIAGDGVANRQREKAEPQAQQDQVQHADLLRLATTPDATSMKLRQCDSTDADQADIVSGTAD